MVNVQLLDLTRLPKQAPEPAPSLTRERSSDVAFEDLILEDDHEEETLRTADVNPGMTSPLTSTPPEREINTPLQDENHAALQEGALTHPVAQPALFTKGPEGDEGGVDGAPAGNTILNAPREPIAENNSSVLVTDDLSPGTPVAQMPVEQTESMNPDLMVQGSRKDKGQNKDQIFIPTLDKQDVQLRPSETQVRQNQGLQSDRPVPSIRELPQPVEVSEVFLPVEDVLGLEAQLQKDLEGNQRNLTLSEEEILTVVGSSDGAVDQASFDDMKPFFQMPDVEKQQVKPEELKVPLALAERVSGAEAYTSSVPEMRAPKMRDSQPSKEGGRDLNGQIFADESAQVAVEIQGIPVDGKIRTENPFESAQGTSLPSLSDEVLPLLFAQDNPIRIDMGERNQGQLILPQLAQNADIPLDMVGSHTSLSDAFRLTPEQVLPQLTTALKSTFTREGVDHLRLNLNPASLGKVEVELNISELGHLQMVVCASESNTLDLLQREAETLRQALQEAGYVVDQSGMRFELSQGDSQARQYTLPLEEQEMGPKESQQTSQMTQQSVQVPLTDPNRLLDERV